MRVCVDTRTCLFGLVGSADGSFLPVGTVAACWHQVSVTGKTEMQIPDCGGFTNICPSPYPPPRLLFLR